MKTILLFIIGIYRKYISPLKRRRCCKYYPTCSQYAIDAINEWGAFRGVFMAGWRILRCNPFSRGGIDYVPKRNSRKMTAGEELYRRGVKKENTEQQK